MRYTYRVLLRHEHNGIVWIDLESPSRDEVRAVMDEFNIEALVAEELLLPSARPRADFYANYIFLVLHFPTLKQTHKTREQEIDFVISKKFIITTRYELVDPIHKFSKVFEVNSILENSALGDHAGFVFFSMIKRLYKTIEHELESVRRSLNAIEDKIFEGQEVEMVNEISHVAREFLNIRQSIEPHREILHTLEDGGPSFFGAPFTSYLRALSNDYFRLHNHVMRLTDSLHELRETNNSLLSTKQNETMKLFTILAFVTLPLTLMTGIFGMNTAHTPIVGNTNDFWIVLGMMGVTAICMFAYFRWRRWL